MKDYYETRKSYGTRFIYRQDAVAAKQPDCFTEVELEFYRANGYLIKRDFFDISMITEALHAATAITEEGEHIRINREPTGKRIRSALQVHMDSPFSTILADESLHDIARGITGGDWYVHQSRINYKSGLGTNGWNWHSDFETWHSQDGMPAMRAFSAMIPLQANTPENGCLMVVPKSHSLFCSCSKVDQQISAESEFSEQKEGIPSNEAIESYFELSGGRVESIVCDAGDLVLFDCNTLHVSNPNMTPYGRTNLFFVINSLDNKLVQPYSGNAPRPGYMATR